MRGSGQRLPITLRFTRVLGTFSHTTCFPFSCALWACFSDRSVSGEHSEPIGAPMPHAALWVVQRSSETHTLHVRAEFQCRTRLCGWCNPCKRQLAGGLFRVSMPHAALWVVQRRIYHEQVFYFFVSMPHAALWVVQLVFKRKEGFLMKFQCRTRLCGWCNSLTGRGHIYTGRGFNAARGFVGGATFRRLLHRVEPTKFQCRTRLCGWCNEEKIGTGHSGFRFQCRTRLCGWCNFKT